MTTTPAELLQLTTREREVVDLRLRRMGRREIAHLLGISPVVVKQTLDRARRRNGCEDEVVLLIRVTREGMTG